jgi:hypothetical protein
MIRRVQPAKLMKIFGPCTLFCSLLACTAMPSSAPEANLSDAVIQRSESEEEEGPGYRILKQGRQNHENWLQLNEYFLIHHLYADVFRRFGLHKIFSLEDKMRILAALLYNLDLQTPVNLVIDDFSEQGPLVVSLQLIRIGGQRSVVLATNTDEEGSRIYVGVENLAKTYKRSYLIVADQMVALKDLYSRSKESKLIAENSADNLSWFYIFDGNTSNDTVAEGLLIGSIREAESPLDRSRSELILSRYYMSRNRLAEAQALLLAVGRELAGTENSEALRESFSVAYEELLITNALKDQQERIRESLPESL